jgi:hypothetical protein
VEVALKELDLQNQVQLPIRAPCGRRIFVYASRKLKGITKGYQVFHQGPTPGLVPSGKEAFLKVVKIRSHLQPLIGPYLPTLRKRKAIDHQKRKSTESLLTQEENLQV